MGPNIDRCIKPHSLHRSEVRALSSEDETSFIGCGTGTTAGGKVTPPTTDQTIGRGTGNTAVGEVTPPTTDQTIGRGTGNTAGGEVTPPTTDQTIGRGTENTAGGAAGIMFTSDQDICRLEQDSRFHNGYMYIISPVVSCGHTLQ